MTDPLQHALYVKLISFAASAIMATIAALFGLYMWLCKRQVRRIDSHDRFNIEIAKSHERLSANQDATAMQLRVVKEQSEKTGERLKADLEDHKVITDKRGEAMEKAFDRQMKMLEKYLETLVKQGERRRNVDDQAR